MNLKKRLEKLEEKTGVKEDTPKAIEVLFVEMDGTVSGSMLIPLDQRRAEA